MRKALLVLGVVGIAFLATLWLRDEGERAGARRPEPGAAGPVEKSAQAELLDAPVPEEATRAPVLDAENIDASERRSAPVEHVVPARTLLHVRDRATNRELDPVLLCEVGGFDHPGAAGEDALNAGPSPVEVPELEQPILGTRSLHARSPGYGWGRIEIDESLGGERILLLDPAGELEVIVAGVVSAPWTKLRLWGSGRAPVFEQLIASPGTLVIEALAGGTYRVAAEVGEHWNGALALDEAEALVVPGQRRSVTLTLVELVRKP